MQNKFEIILEFIKDLSVETPDAETLIFVKKNISSYQMNIDITSIPLKNKAIEVNTKIIFKDNSNNNKKSFFEIVYATVIKLDDNIKDKSEIEKIILCDVQLKIYPKLRWITHQ